MLFVRAVDGQHKVLATGDTPVRIEATHDNIELLKLHYFTCSYLLFRGTNVFGVLEPPSVPSLVMRLLL